MMTRYRTALRRSEESNSNLGAHQLNSGGRVPCQDDQPVLHLESDGYKCKGQARGATVT